MMTGVLHVWLRKWVRMIFIKSIFNVPRTISMFLMVIQKFFRPKRMDGNWETPFNPIEVGLPIRKPQPGSIASLYLTM